MAKVSLSLLKVSHTKWTLSLEQQWVTLAQATQIQWIFPTAAVESFIHKALWIQFITVSS